jgi:hypothetical protein
MVNNRDTVGGNYQSYELKKPYNIPALEMDIGTSNIPMACGHPTGPKTIPAGRGA